MKKLLLLVPCAAIAMVGCSTKPDIGNADVKLTSKPTGPKGVMGGPGPTKGASPNTSSSSAKVAQPQ